MDKLLFNGGLNFDDSDRLIPAGDYRWALNCHIGVSESENTGTVTNVKGNTLITFALPGGQNTCIGTFEDKKDNTVIYFVYNANSDHQILRYTPVTNTITSIIKNSLLNFDPSYLITGIAFVEGTLLFWCDGNEEAGFIDIDGLANGNYPSTLTAQHIRAIPYAPNFPPGVQYTSHPTRTVNNLRNSLFQFKYQYVYKDNRPSAWSPISKLPLPTTELVFGNSLPSQIDNCIKITLNTGDFLVKQIKIAARIGNIGDFFLIETLDKFSSTQQLIVDDIDKDVDFFNDGLYPSIEINESNKLFDFFPLAPKALSPIDGNRMTYGNGVSGFDPVELDITINPIIHPLSDLNTTVNPGISLSSGLSLLNINAPLGSNPTLGDVYTFSFRLRILVVFPPPFNITKMWETKQYQYVDAMIYGDNFLTILNRIKSQIENDITLTTPMFVNVVDTTDSFTTANPIVVIVGAFGWGYDLNINTVPVSFISGSLSGTPTPIFISSSLITNTSKSVRKCFKSGATHEFGIIYYDGPNRSGTVNISPQSKIYVPFQSERIVQDGWVDMRIFIGHQPPIWATHYQLAYTKNQNISNSLVTPESVTIVGNKATMVLTNLGLFQTDTPGTRLSYDWAKGDRIRFILNRTTSPETFLTTYVDLEIMSFDSGTNTITFQVDSNITNGTQYLVELYTPQKIITSKLYYEIGECYEIGDAGLSTRYHKGNVQNQIINPNQEAEIVLTNQGDVYFRSRLFTATSLYLEDPNYSDLFISNYCNIGRPNVYDSNAMQQRRPATVWYSQPFIPDTNINGFGSFFDTNFEEYNKIFDSIQLMYQQESSLLIFQELKVGKILINQRRFSDTQGQSVVSASLDVLATPADYYAGEYGIGVHPESFAVYGNRKYFCDYQRGVVLRLSQDGITPISEYNLHSYFTQRFKDIMAYGWRTVANGVYDVKYGRYILSLEKKVITPPKAGSNSSPAITYERETIAFDEASNRWKMFFSFQPEYMCGSNLDVILFKDGELYLNDSNDNRGEFFGVSYPMELTFVHNEAPANMKVYNAIQTDSNEPFSMELTNQFGQRTSLLESDFENIEKVFWAALWKDENTPVTNPLFEGDDIRCHTATIKLTNNLSTFVKLFAVGVKTQSSELTNK